MKHDEANTSPKKSNMKPSKSKNASSIKSADSSSAASSGASEGEDAEGGSSDVEEQSSPEGDVDALALSDAQLRPTCAANKVLAGLKQGDVTMNDEVQATAGAERDMKMTPAAIDEDEDDDYADVEDVSDSDVDEDVAEDVVLLPRKISLMNSKTPSNVENPTG